MSLLKILKKLLCPLPVKACITNGCCAAPKVLLLNTAAPNNAGSGTDVKVISVGCGVSKLS